MTPSPEEMDPSCATDPYFKKVVPLEYGGQTLRFRLAVGLFSSYDVDVGTRRLLRTLAGERPARVLDLGCGYGPLGLAIKAALPESLVHLVDRDALALEYARQNAALNGLDVQVYASLGYDDLRERGVDLIVSNIPAKAGPPVIEHLLLGAREYLSPAGEVAVVIVSDLEEMVAAVLHPPEVEILQRRAWRGHTVLRYRFPDPQGPPAGPALERGVYDREEGTLSWGGYTFSLRTVWGLEAAFGFSEEMLLRGVARLPEGEARRVLWLNPGQGYGVVVLWHLVHPEQIALVDRDLLALRASRRNLLRNGCPEGQVLLFHQIGAALPGKETFDLVAGLLREAEGPAALLETVRQAAAQLAPGGRLVLVAGSTAITRLLRGLQGEHSLQVEQRERRRGQSLLLLRHR